MRMSRLAGGWIRLRQVRARWAIWVLAALTMTVGNALGRNPIPVIIPCHRVLAAGGKVGGFSANGGVKTKLKMLAIEGAAVNHTPSLFD